FVGCKTWTSNRRVHLGAQIERRCFMKIVLEETMKEIVNLHREDKAIEATKAFWSGCWRAVIGCMAAFLIMGISLHAGGWRLEAPAGEVSGQTGPAPPLPPTGPIGLPPKGVVPPPDPEPS